MKVTTTVPKKCLNCDTTLGVGTRFCPCCGQAAAPPRLTLHEIGHDFVHALVHVDRSALTLIRQLLVRPGVVARDYIDGRRKRYYGPFTFLTVVVALTSAEIALTGFQMVTSDIPNAVADFLQRHINLVFFVQVPILAGACRIVGLRDRYNYAEYLVPAAYATSILVLFYGSIVIPAWYVFAPGPAVSKNLYLAYWPLWPLYFGYAASQFMRGGRLRATGKGILAVLLTRGMTYLLVFVASNLQGWTHRLIELRK